jgi:hypothetical protein
VRARERPGRGTDVSASMFDGHADRLVRFVRAAKEAPHRRGRALDDEGAGVVGAEPVRWLLTEVLEEQLTEPRNEVDLEDRRGGDPSGLRIAAPATIAWSRGASWGLTVRVFARQVVRRGTGVLGTG